jgi:hypothetical protein
MLSHVAEEAKTSTTNDTIMMVTKSYDLVKTITTQIMNKFQTATDRAVAVMNPNFFDLESGNNLNTPPFFIAFVLFLPFQSRATHNMCRKI